jgi:hypothetical protein
MAGAAAHEPLGRSRRQDPEVLDVTTDYLLVETSPRRPLHAPENLLGVLRSVIDGLVTRLRALAGGIS